MAPKTRPLEDKLPGFLEVFEGNLIRTYGCENADHPKEKLMQTLRTMCKF